MLATYSLNMYIHSAFNGFSLKLISARLSALLYITRLKSQSLAIHRGAFNKGFSQAEVW